MPPIKKKGPDLSKWKWLAAFSRRCNNRLRRLNSFLSSKEKGLSQTDFRSTRMVPSCFFTTYFMSKSNTNTCYFQIAIIICFLGNYVSITFGLPKAAQIDIFYGKNQLDCTSSSGLLKDTLPRDIHRGMERKEEQRKKPRALGTNLQPLDH